jgi:hypothetical protein
MTIGVPAAVDPVALALGALAALALVVAPALVLALGLLLLLLLLLQAATPATIPTATHAVAILLYFIPASWGDRSLMAGKINGDANGHASSEGADCCA